MVEFDCEGCGVHVIDVSNDCIPASHWCSTCGFIHWAVHDSSFIVQRELLVHLGAMKPLARLIVGDEQEDHP
jgi:hypothetical protein